jgi:hypothetical protein
MRSFFTDIDVFVSEVKINALDSRQVAIIKEIMWSIGEGLRICSDAFNLL